MKKGYALLVLPLLLSMLCPAQSNMPEPDWPTLESSIHGKRFLEDTRNTLMQVKQQALEAGRPAIAGRCYYDLLLIADAKSEDSLFFKNALFMDSILRREASPPLLKAIMHLLKARRLDEFDARFYYHTDKNLIISYDPAHKYGSMPRPVLDSLIKQQLDTALQISLSLGPIPSDELLWLSADPLSFLFKPGFTDIVYAEMIRLAQGTSYGDNSGRNPGWLSLSQDAFMQLPDTATAFTPKGRAIFSRFRQWMQYHQPSEPQAWYYIETLARKYFYNSLPADSATNSRYEQYLLTLLQSPYSTVKANGVYQLCLLWNARAMDYNPSARDYYNYNRQKFDSAPRLYYVKALDLYTRHENLLDSFYFMKKILLAMKTRITARALTISVNDNQLPNEPMAVFLKYRNIRQLCTRVVKKITPSPPVGAEEKFIARLLQAPVVAEAVQPLPDPGDYQLHNVLVKQDALPAGNYYLLYSDTTIGSGAGHISYIAITVTTIAVINNDRRVYVLDRKTGFPLAGASVQVSYKETEKKGNTSDDDWKDRAPVKVNAEGYITVEGKKKETWVTVSLNGDTLETDINNVEVDLPKSVYNKDEEDDLMDYYTDNTRLNLFTDRAIYRPGQTVYYKGIFITRNPKTGELLVLNRKNLQLPFFKKLLYRLELKFSKERFEVYVKDPFSREMDTIRVFPNSFGSFAGSFKVPVNAATGEWRFEASEADMDNQNNGRFAVEEYKRPAFELSIDKPKNELSLGDSFRVKILVKSFAGAPLANVLVKYSVARSGDLPSTGSDEERSVHEDLAEEQAYTNDKGELQILVSDSLLRQYHFSSNLKWDASYTISAEAIDATGESHEEHSSFLLSTRPVQFTIPLTASLDRNDMPLLYISAKSSFAGPVKKDVEVLIYKTAPRDKERETTAWPPTDINLYPGQNLRQWLGNNYAGDEMHNDDQLVYRVMTTAGGEDKLLLPKDILQSGYYRIKVTGRENGNITGETEKEFTIFDKAARTLPGATASFHYLQNNIVGRGNPIDWITGNTEKDVYSIYHLAWYAKSNKGIKVRYAYDTRVEKKGLNEWRYTMPVDAIGDITLTHIYIFDNQLYREVQTVALPYHNTANPEVIVEQYRKILTPGGKETFTVSVKTKNPGIAAELMTTMYDASLDKLEAHRWSLPQDDYYQFRINNEWDNSINTQLQKKLYADDLPGLETQAAGSNGVWWLSSAANNFPAFNYSANGYMANMLEGRVAGLMVVNANGLDDVVVVGYGTSRKSASLSEVIAIRGTISFKEYNNMLVIIDGVPYTGDINKLNPNSITNGIVLKGADATDIYGSRAATGVLVLSTKGPVVLPTAPQALPPPDIRRNFSETAFFYPQVHAGRDGYYTIGFTLPESVTEWKWKLLAHTRKAGFAYAERTVFSQLPLMVQPAMPRFLFQGDKIVLQSRITNLDSSDLAGTLECSIEDAETGKDITAQLVTSYRQSFSVQRHSNGSGAFTLTVPPGLLHPLRVKISAVTGKFSDGEEHLIPVLTGKILVSRTMPVVVKDKSEGHLATPAMPADATPYGIGLYINPQPQAAMINALPSLANCPYNCAEQTFNKLLAAAIAIRVMRTDTAAQHAMALQQPAMDNTPSADAPGEQTMPWLQLNHATAINQANLHRLLDTLQAHTRIETYFTDIAGMQNIDGGVPWFKGGTSSLYISHYLLAAFGKLLSDGLPFPGKGSGRDQFPRFVAKLIGYCDKQFEARDGYDNFSGYLYARSYWVKEYPLAGGLKQKLDSLPGKWLEKTEYNSIGQQAQLVTAILRYAGKNSPAGQEALKQLESIRQLAITDETNGTRWKAVSNSDDLDMQTEEWVAKIAESFESSRQYGPVVAGIIKWLLQARQEHGWGNTKSTGEIVSLLSRQQPAVTGPPQQLQATTGQATMTVTNDLFSGRLYAFTDQTGSTFPGSVTVHQTGPYPVSGGISYYYFTAHPPVDSNGNGVLIAKSLLRYNTSTRQWDSITGSTRLAIADKIKTVLTIQAPRELRYVFINDTRAAALEPVDAESGYEYATPVAYYKSVRDAGFNFFAERVPLGISTISYETAVSMEGSFSNGPASLQCMYNPGVRAYSGSMTINVYR